MVDYTGLYPVFGQRIEELRKAALAQFGVDPFSITSGYRSPEQQAQIIYDNWHKFDLDQNAKDKWMQDVAELGAKQAGDKWEPIFSNAKRTADQGRGDPFRNWIGLPARSYHQGGGYGKGGLAADIKYASPEVSAWIRQNAANYGLNFPLGNEPWHIELAGVRDGKLPAGDPLNAIASLGKINTGTGGDTRMLNPMKKDEMSLVDYLKNPASIADRMTRRSEVTGLNPSEAFAAALDALILPEMRMGDSIRQQGAQRAAYAQKEKVKNATIGELERLANTSGPKQALAREILGAVKSGALTPAEGYKTLMAQLYDTSGDTIRSSVRFKNGAYYVVTDQGRKVYNAQGFLVPAGPEAEKVLREAELSGIAMEGYGAGTQEQAKFQQKYADELFGKAEKITESISTIDEAIKQIDAGANRGAIIDFLPNITPASAALESALTRMGLDVISTVTFGALSEAEMKAAMATAYPQNINEQELKKWLQDRKNGLIKLRKYSEEAATFLSNPMNTRADWVKRQQDRRDQQEAKVGGNPYLGKSKEELTALFANRNQLNDTQRQQLLEALKAAQ